MPKRTRYRIIAPAYELEHLYHVDTKNLPDNMEMLEDEIHIATYLTDEEYKEREGQLFPRCPVTGAFCNWDPDWPDLFDLL